MSKEDKALLKEKTSTWVTNLVEDWLKPKVRVRQLKEGEVDIPDNLRLYPSSLGSCMRMQWYEKKIPRSRPYVPQWSLMAMIGNGFHRQIGKLFDYEDVRRVPYKDSPYYLCGYPDAICFKGEDQELPCLLLEFKTRDNLNVYRKDIIQVGATALLWPEAKHAAVLTFLRSPIMGENYRVEYLTERQLTNAKKLAEGKADTLLDFLAKDTLPPEEVSRGCRGCAFQEECVFDMKEE